MSQLHPWSEIFNFRQFQSSAPPFPHYKSRYITTPETGQNLLYKIKHEAICPNSIHGPKYLTFASFRVQLHQRHTIYPQPSPRCKYFRTDNKITRDAIRYNSFHGPKYLNFASFRVQLHQRHTIYPQPSPPRC
jgi:hypothetical protein